MSLFGFIGTGNMGGALAKAVRMRAKPDELVLHNRTAAKAEALASELGCKSGTLAEAAACRYLFLGVKPQMMADLMDTLRPLLEGRDDFVLVSMAAGITVEQLCGLLGRNVPVLRLMPNTPVGIGKGVVLYCSNELLSDTDSALLTDALSGAGLVEPLEEGLMDVGSAVCGCSPAFTDLYLEALADGGVACGLPRAKAIRLAAAAIAGAAELALATGKHPGQLKDEVCSPGGSTIQGVRTLENHGFRAAVMEAVLAAAGASGDLGKK